MIYYIGQAFGILSTVCCLLMPLMKKKWQMLVFNGANNLLVILNMLLIDGVNSAIMVCAVAVVQVLVALRHLNKDTQVTKGENLLFLVLYVACGVIGFRRTFDVLPIVGAVFNMLATFQRDEQRTRVLLFLNASTFAVYYVIIRSTALLAVLCTMVSSLLGLWRYRKKKQA